MSNKSRLQTNNTNLQVLIDKANALPDAGSGGGVTTAAITVNAIGSIFYYVGEDGAKEVSNISTTVQAVVPSICACFTEIGAMASLQCSGSCSALRSNMVNALVYITGDSSISFSAQMDGG